MKREKGTASKTSSEMNRKERVANHFPSTKKKKRSGKTPSMGLGKNIPFERRSEDLRAEDAINKSREGERGGDAERESLRISKKFFRV